MFENEETGWDRINALIDLRCALALAEIKHQAEMARDAIDVRLGFSQSFIRRSRGQRKRHAARHQQLETA